jgi:DRTGG domain.
MKISEFVTKIDAKVLTKNIPDDRKVTGIYCCDLLSWVMSHAQKGDAWITVLTNINIVAVALLTEAACIIIPEGIVMEEAAINRAEKEGVVILSTELDTYKICSRVPGL